ncbi:MAG: hypothetical protein R2737_03185 [Candidatus Nanopelagicales bacterium]
MTESLRSLLESVAAGAVSPAEAARRLEDGTPAPVAPDGSAATPPHPSTATSTATPTRVAIRGSHLRLRVEADPAVAVVSVTGPHRIVPEGDTLRVDAGASQDAPAADGYRVDERIPTWLSWLPKVTDRGTRVVVRVNPALAVDLDVIGSSAEVTGLRAALRARVSSASLRVADHRGPVDLAGTTAGIDVEALLDAGESRVVSELSSATVRLLPGSDVEVRASADLGTVSVKDRRDDEVPTVPADGDLPVTTRTARVGSGAATLRVEARLGAVAVVLP